MGETFEDVEDISRLSDNIARCGFGEDSHDYDQALQAVLKREKVNSIKCDPSMCVQLQADSVLQTFIKECCYTLPKAV